MQGHAVARASEIPLSPRKAPDFFSKVLPRERRAYAKPTRQSRYRRGDGEKKASATHRTARNHHMDLSGARGGAATSNPNVPTFSSSI
jgi:hypothetical protein